MCGKGLFICGRDSAGRYGARPTDSETICKARCPQVGAKSAAGRSTASESVCAQNAKGGSKMSRMQMCQLPPPCRGCTLVRNPAACENKACKQWQRWFIKRWDRFHTYPRQMMDKTLPVGISIGGRRYLHPDQLREYIRKNPCEGCSCTADLCRTPCRAKTIWEKAKQEVNYELEK